MKSKFLFIGGKADVMELYVDNNVLTYNFGNDVYYKVNISYNVDIPLFISSSGNGTSMLKEKKEEIVSRINLNFIDAGIVRCVEKFVTKYFICDVGYYYHYEKLFSKISGYIYKVFTNGGGKFIIFDPIVFEEHFKKINKEVLL